jgi:hypothetical protein
MEPQSDPVLPGGDLRIVSAGPRERRERRNQHQGCHRTAFIGVFVETSASTTI